MIAAFTHQKGGTGKSTMTVAVALWLAKRGRVVQILDVDPQGTLTAWGSRYGRQFGVDVIPSHARLVKQDVLDYAQRYDDVLVDLPPTVTPQTEEAIEVADLLIIPMRPTQADLWALDRLVALVLLSKRRPPPTYKVLLTQTTSGDEARVMGPLQKRRIDLFTQTIPFGPHWQDLFQGKGLTDEMDAQLTRIIAELPTEVAPLDN